MKSILAFSLLLMLPYTPLVPQSKLSDERLTRLSFMEVFRGCDSADEVVLLGCDQYLRGFIEGAAARSPSNLPFCLPEGTARSMLRRSIYSYAVEMMKTNQNMLSDSAAPHVAKALVQAFPCDAPPPNRR